MVSVILRGGVCRGRCRVRDGSSRVGVNNRVRDMVVGSLVLSVVGV